MNNSALIEPTNEEIEIFLLKNVVRDEVYDLPRSIKSILSGEYEDVIKNGLPLTVIELLCGTKNFQKTVHDSIETEVCSRRSWFSIAVASLLHFVRCNWTGPQIAETAIWLKNKREDAFRELSLHDECNTNVRNPELLYFCKTIFSSEILQSSFKSSTWWLFRANLLHQLVLNETSGVIFEETEELIKTINDSQLLNDDYCKTLFNIEAAQFYFYFKRIQNSEKHVDQAQQTAKLTMSLEGALGKRTKYQHEEKAQLFLKTKMEKNCFPFERCENLPKSLDLNDDVRLECIEFSEPTEDRAELGAVEEAIVLARHVQLQLSQPRDKLIDEEIKPYLVTVIDSTKNWSLKFTSLYRRCLMESADKRTIERSMMQMEYLIQELKSTEVPASKRMDLFFASGLQPVWALEQMWAHLMLSLGLVKGALDIFIKLELWEEVIACYNILELKHKAAEIIRQEISKKPTVQLWCLLGDATGDPSNYETAWKLSNERSSRAQRHWGYFYFAKKNYEEAVPHLKLSVELNNIQEQVWMRLGFAALQTEDWKLAAMAYRRYCALEQSTFEAWNNLANAYIKLGDKPRAWKSLQDAIKCNYNHWKVWDNLMVVSIDLGYFSEVIRSYHRILDLKDHHLDVQVLEILTNAIINDVNDGDGNPARKLLPKALELFGRISSITRTNPDVWRMYAQLTALKETDTDDEKVIQLLQHAHRAAVLNPKWFQEEESTGKVLQLCSMLADTCLHCASDDCEAKKKKTLLASAKLPLQGVVRKVKEQQWEDEKIASNLEKVEKYLNDVKDELEKIK